MILLDMLSMNWESYGKTLDGISSATSRANFIGNVKTAVPT
jgi:hypothetical protein